MKDERTWPLGHLLPLRRDSDELWPELGLLVAGVASVMHVLTLAATPKIPRPWQTERWKSFDEVLEDDWVIDNGGDQWTRNPPPART